MFRSSAERDEFWRQSHRGSSDDRPNKQGLCQRYYLWWLRPYAGTMRFVGRTRFSPAARYLDWRRGAEVGCVFARLVARRPAHYHQVVKVIGSAGTSRRVAGSVARHVGRLADDEAVSAAVLLLPDVATLDVLARIALALGEQPQWAVTTTMLHDTPVGDLVAVHLVREIAFADGRCPSEALIFGPMRQFPPTRRAPVTALEIYVGRPRPFDPKTAKPTNKANLAHLELNLPSQAAFDRMWWKSVEGRLASLGSEDGRAKAKVSFVIPIALAKELGCIE